MIIFNSIFISFSLSSESLKLDFKKVWLYGYTGLLCAISLKLDKLQKDISSEIVVIGGGYTGLLWQLI